MSVLFIFTIILAKWNSVQICSKDCEIALALGLLIKRYTSTQHRNCSLRSTSDLKELTPITISNQIWRIRRHTQYIRVHLNPFPKMQLPLSKA